MVLKSSRHNVCTGNTVRSKWAHSKHEFHPVIRKSVLGSGDCDGDMFDITSGYVRCGDEYFLDDGCLETGPSIQGTLLYSLNKRGRWKIPTLLARTPSRPTGRTGRTDASRREQGNENLIAKAHHFLSKQASCYQCFSVKPLGGSSGWTPNQTGLTEKERLKATRQRTMALSRRKDHKKRVPVDEEEEDPMVQLLDRTGQRPEVQYDVCLTCPSSPLQVDLEDDRSCRPLQTTSRKLKYSHTNVLSQFQEYMDAEDDMMEDIFDWAIYDSLNDSPLPNTSLPPNDPPSPVDDDVKLNDFVDANDFQLGDHDSDLLCGIEVIEGDLQTDGEPEPARIGALLGDWVTPGPRKSGNGKRNKRRKSSVEGGWEFVDKEELCGVQDWEVVPNHGRL